MTRLRISRVSTGSRTCGYCRKPRLRASACGTCWCLCTRSISWRSAGHSGCLTTRSATSSSNGSARRRQPVAWRKSTRRFVCGIAIEGMSPRGSPRASKRRTTPIARRWCSTLWPGARARIGRLEITAIGGGQQEESQDIGVSVGDLYDNDEVVRALDEYRRRLARARILRGAIDPYTIVRVRRECHVRDVHRARSSRLGGVCRRSATRGPSASCSCRCAPKDRPMKICLKMPAPTSRTTSGCKGTVTPWSRTPERRPERADHHLPCHPWPALRGGHRHDQRSSRDSVAGTGRRSPASSADGPTSRRSWTPAPRPFERRIAGADSPAPRCSQLSRNGRVSGNRTATVPWTVRFRITEGPRTLVGMVSSAERDNDSRGGAS